MADAKLGMKAGLTRFSIRITYLNERDSKGATVEVALPRVDDGIFSSFEFGPELYRLPLPDKILRNHWYKYEVEI